VPTVPVPTVAVPAVPGPADPRPPAIKLPVAGVARRIRRRAVQGGPRRVGRRPGDRPRLVSVGDVVLDIVVRPERPVASGTDVPGTISFRAGGSAANTCSAFARLGGAATLICAVGHDRSGRRLVSALRAEGVAVRAATVEAATARLVALVSARRSARGERSFVTQRGAADQLRPAHVEAAWFRGAHFLHLPAYSLLGGQLSRAALAACGHARQQGALVTVDLASRQPLLDLGRGPAAERIAAAAPDVLFANGDEAAALAGAHGAKELLRLAPLVVVKEGVAGCRVIWRPGSGTVMREIDVATEPLDAADTTGAGDAFDAGFLHHLAAGSTDPPHTRPVLDLRRAAVAGHRAAARLLTGPRPELAL
jgi:sugar/nucleoside kinase (ribokinase family)